MPHKKAQNSVISGFYKIHLKTNRTILFVDGQFQFFGIRIMVFILLIS